jgi:hypothetical protein
MICAFAEKQKRKTAKMDTIISIFEDSMVGVSLKNLAKHINTNCFQTASEVLLS